MTDADLGQQEVLTHAELLYQSVQVIVQFNNNKQDAEAFKKSYN